MKRYKAAVTMVITHHIDLVDANDEEEAKKFVRAHLNRVYGKFWREIDTDIVEIEKEKEK
jgi:DNA-binding GntR family transcriptional regulator